MPAQGGTSALSAKFVSLEQHDQHAERVRYPVLRRHAQRFDRVGFGGRQNELSNGNSAESDGVRSIY